MKVVIRHLLGFYRAHATLLNILAKYGFGIVAFAYVIVQNWSGLVEIFTRPPNVGPLLLAFAITVAGLILTFLRWHLLARAVDVPLTRYDAIRLGLAGYFFNTFLPGSIGGDIVKAVAMARDQERRTRAVATIGIDRVIGLWSLIWFVAIIGTFFMILDDPILQNPKLKAIITFTIVFSLSSLAVYLMVGLLSEARADRIATRLEGLRKVGTPLAEFWRACWMYRKKSRAVLIAVLMSLAGHAGWVVVFDLSVHAFEAPNPEVNLGSLPEHMVIVPVGMTVSAVVPVPGGIGVGDMAYGTLYEFIGKQKKYGIAGCMSQRVIFWFIGLVGYVVYTRMPVRGEQKNEPGLATVRVAPPEPESPQKGVVMLRTVAADP